MIILNISAWYLVQTKRNCSSKLAMSIVCWGVLSPLFYEKSPILPTPTLSDFVQPCLSLSCPTSNPNALSVVLFFGWMGDHTTFDVLFYLMILWVCTCQALRRWCVFYYATRCQVYGALTHNVVSCWCFDLISHTHKHMQHTLRGQ